MLADKMVADGDGGVGTVGEPSAGTCSSSCFPPCWPSPPPRGWAAPPRPRCAGSASSSSRSAALPGRHRWRRPGRTGLGSGRRGPRTDSAAARPPRPLLRGPQTDQVDEEVLAAFAREHRGLRLAPVVVVIAAYDEAAGLPGVLANLPRVVAGLATDVLVVDDGSTDGTAEAARASGAPIVAACPVNRGQGRALRLGYRIAREHGASYVVTTDADGQYSPDEIADVLAPVVEGWADFVTGSRRLGALENKDAVRQAGTYVFAWLASAAARPAHHRHLVRAAGDARRGDGGGHPQPAAVPGLGAAGRRALPRLPAARGARHHAGPVGGRDQEGRRTWATERATPASCSAPGGARAARARWPRPPPPCEARSAMSRPDVPV